MEKNTIKDDIVAFISNNKDSNVILENIIQIIQKKPLETIKEILLICNDYISTKQITFKTKTLELLNKLIEENIPIIQPKIYDFIKKVFKDITCVPLIMKGFLQLYHKCLNDPIFMKDIVNFISEMFTCEKLNLPAYNQETRNYCLKILSMIIPSYYFNNIESVKMITVVIDCIEGEKDPRNLLLVFKIVSLMYNVFSHEIIKPFDKNIYDILIDYYPIDFTPPKNSPDCITAKDLSNALNECLSIEYFSKYFFDEMKEYDSNLFDVFNTIQSITNCYLDDELRKYYQPISDFIINGIMNNEDETVHIEGLITYNFFIKRISQHYNGNEDNDEIARDIRKTYDYLADQLFSIDDIKRSCDAKDLLCVLIEYSNDAQIIKNTIELIIKTLSHFLITKKHFILLKNINSLLFFALRNNKVGDFFMMFIENKKMFIALQELMNDSSFIKEKAFMSVIDILSAIIIKYNNIYTIEEISKLSNQIISIYYSSENMSRESMNHIAYCLSELMLNYKDLDITEKIIKSIQVKTQDIVLLKALLKHHNKKEVILKYFIDHMPNDDIINVMCIICKENITLFTSLPEENIKKMNDNILNNYKNESFYPLINELIERNIIIDQHLLLMKLLNNSDNLIFINQYALIKKIITKGKINHDDLYDKLLFLYNQFSLALILNQKCLNKIGKCIFYTIINCSQNKRNTIQSFLMNHINTLFLQSTEETLIINEIIIAHHLNSYLYDCLNIETNTIIKIIDLWFDNLQLVSSNKLVIKAYETSRLFQVAISNNEIKDLILIKLRSLSKSAPLLDKSILSLMLNIYSNNKESNDNGDILFILSTKALLNEIQTVKAIYIIKNVMNKANNHNYFKRFNCDYKALLSKLLDVLLKETNQNNKIDILKLIGLFRRCIEYDEDYFKAITIQLRKCLNDKKRMVRKICGITITIWNLIE